MRRIVVVVATALGLLVSAGQATAAPGDSALELAGQAAANAQGASYQIRQSLIAIGSGGLVGRGFGQSVQKFTYLPEPVGDSIFAVAAEEFGFVGSVTLIALFLLFARRETL